MAKEITDMQIRVISLVKAGANNKKIIYKDKHFSEALRVNFSKNNEEQGIVYGIVYAPNEVDLQGEFATTNEIKKAAYEFMKNADVAHCVDVNHNFESANAYICESWIVKSKDEFFSEVGAWAVGVKIEDENLKERIKSGELTGLSMYGSGVIKNDEGNSKNSVMAALKEFFGTNESVKKENLKTKGEKMDENRVSELVKAALSEGVKVQDEKLSTLEKSISEISAKLEAISCELSKSKQSIEPVQSENCASKGVL